MYYNFKNMRVGYVDIGWYEIISVVDRLLFGVFSDHHIGAILL